MQRGWRGFAAPVTPVPSREQDLLTMKQQAERLEQALSELKARIRDLDTPTSDVTGKELR
jgi:hypothetical protein